MLFEWVFILNILSILFKVFLGCFIFSFALYRL
jgi:hypothetical protein